MFALWIVGNPTIFFASPSASSIVGYNRLRYKPRTLESLVIIMPAGTIEKLVYIPYISYSARFANALFAAMARNKSDVPVLNSDT